MRSSRLRGNDDPCYQTPPTRNGGAAGVDDMADFYPQLVNNPEPALSVDRLKFIGKWFTGRFARGLHHVTTLHDLLNVFRTHTKAQNTIWLRDILVNKRRLRCIPAPQR